MIRTAALLAITLIVLAGSAGAASGRWRPKQIIVTFWCPPPATDEALARVASEGYNMTWLGAGELDAAQRHGLRAMVQDGLLTPATLDSPEQRAKLDAMIERVKNHPAMEAYFITDEPSALAFGDLGRLVAYLRERDPKHLAYINLFPTYANNQQLGTKGDTVTAYKEHLRLYMQKVKPGLISWDHYIFNVRGETDQYFLNLGLIRDEALKEKVPFLNIIQAAVWDPSVRMPVAEEMRWQVYTSLAYGARGISYFVYWTPEGMQGLYEQGKPRSLAADVAKLNHEINALSPALMGLNTLSVYQTIPTPIGGETLPADSPVGATGGEFVLGLFGEQRDVTAFMVVNRDHRNAATATLTMPRYTTGVEERTRTGKGRWIVFAAPKDGKITVPLAPGDGRLFRLVRDVPRDGHVQVQHHQHR
jgi:hypothetical protein